MTDVPAHEPDEEPFCPVKWRDGVAALDVDRVRRVSIQVQARMAPKLRKATQAFLEGVASGGEVHKVGKHSPADTAAAAVERAAETRDLDPEAKAVLERFGVALA